MRDLPASALHGLVSRMARIEAFRGRWEETRKPSGALRKRLFARAAAESARAATRIVSGASPPEEGGYARTLHAVFEGFAEMPLEEDRILALHAGIFRNSPAGSPRAGKYKTAAGNASTFQRWDVEPVALRAPGPLLIPAQMDALTWWFASRAGGEEFHPLLVAAAYILEFLAIRPFADGNTRVSRILMNLLLLRSGHTYLPYGSLDRIISGDWTEYYLALRRSQASRNLPRPDISPWLLTFLDLVILQQREVRETMDRLPDERKLSRNQEAVLAIARRDGDVALREAAAEIEIPRETAKQALRRLAALGALRRTGSGRATRYRLEER